MFTYSPTRIIPPPKPGDRLKFREFNSRSHHGPDATCVSVQGKEITVIMQRSGRKSEWLLRDFLPHGHHGTNDRFDETSTK